MDINRRDVLKSVGATVAATALQGKASAQSAPQVRQARSEKPNILIFFTDDHGQWLQQAYGNSEVKTPNMERIARSGVRMLNAYTTCPVCSPSRASFFTGRMPSQHGIHDYLDDSGTSRDFFYPWLKGQTLISEPLKKAGYHTGLVGKWHCGLERQPQPGFDYWYSFWTKQKPHLGPQNFSDNGRHIPANGFQSPYFTTQAVRFLENHYANKATAQQPFFLFVSYTDTHRPHRNMPEDLVAEYRDATFRDIPREPFYDVHGIPLIPASSDPAIENRKRKQYYASASSVDREVGHVLDTLDSLGQTENTIIIYTGDHGLNGGHHGIWEKGNATVPQNFLEESIRVSCAIAWHNGGIPTDLASDIQVNHCDLFQTLLDAAGATPGVTTARQINSPGKSYLAHLLGKATDSWRNSVVCEYGNARMIKRDNYKLIRRYPFKGLTFRDELYDLKADPRETENIHAKPRYSALIRNLSAEIDQFFARYTVPGHSGLDVGNGTRPEFNDKTPWMRAEHMRRNGVFTESPAVLDSQSS